MSIADGKLLTQELGAKEKLELTKKLSERYNLPIHLDPDATALALVCDQIRSRKHNKIAHGMWLIIDKKISLAISCRINRFGPCHARRVATELTRMEN